MHHALCQAGTWVASPLQQQADTCSCSCGTSVPLCFVADRVCQYCHDLRTSTVHKVTARMWVKKRAAHEPGWLTKLQLQSWSSDRDTAVCRVCQDRA